MKTRSWWMTLFGLSALALTASANAATYHVTVNTQSLSGLSGFLDLQLNPADIGAPSASANVQNLMGGLSLTGAPDVIGDIAGVLPGSLMLGNLTAFNDYFQSVTFGETFNFDVSFTGDFLTQSSALGTSFALSLFASDAVSPLLSTDLSGSLLRFDLSQNGIGISTFPSAVGAPPAAQVNAVPLPGAIWLLISGLGLMFGRNVRRRAN